MRFIMLACFLILVPTAHAQSEDELREGTYDEAGSELSFEETSARLEAAIADMGFTLVAKVPHSKAAEGAGLELRPTTLFIFGNPAAGTRLMQDEPRMALELPLKMVVYEAEPGMASILYTYPEAMAERAGLPSDHPVIQNMIGVMEELIRRATAPMPE